MGKKKALIIGGVAAAVVIIAAVVAVLLFGKDKKVSATTMRLLRIEGIVTLESGGVKKDIVNNLKLNSGDVLSTEVESLASISLDDNKAVTLEELSSAEFLQDGKKLDLNLQKGSLFFEVNKKLEEDESFQVRTSTMIVGIRGTSGYVFVQKDGKDGILLTTGEVEITGKNPYTGGEKTTTLKAGQVVYVYLYNDEAPENSVDFELHNVTEEEIDPEVIEFLLEPGHEDLFAKVCEETGWDPEKIRARGEELKAAATPTPTPTATATPTATSTPTPTATPTPSPAEGGNGKPSGTPTPVPTVANADSGKPSATPTPAATVTPKATATPTLTPTPTPTVTPTPTKGDDNKNSSPSATPSATPTAKPSATPTVKPSATPTAKPSATPTTTPTATPTVTPTPTPVAVTGVSLDKSDLTLEVAQSATLTAKVTPGNAKDTTVSWSSSNTSVATVSNGVVTAKKAGTATITVKTTDGGKTASCTVTVKPVAVTGVTLNKEELTLTVGDTETLTATVEPEDAGDKTVSWSSSNTTVATVSDGVVTAKKAGTATITVKTTDGGKTATCTITVEPIAVTGVTLDKEELTLTVGDSKTLTATVAPEDAGDKTVSWSSSNTTVATVSDGVVTAKKAGTATITVKTTDGGKTATCSVTVKPVAVTGITLDKTALTLNVGAEEILTATITPEDAANKELSWTSSDTSVVLVSEGIVFGKSAGTATVTAEAADGSGVKASCSVTVEAVPVTSVALNVNSKTLDIGDTLTLEPKILPDNATNKEVTWSSSDETVAVVTDGVVTALKAGTADITVTTEDGGLTDTCAITVNSAVTEFAFEDSSLEVYVGATGTTTINIEPTSELSNVEVSSSAAGVAAVSRSGATITVTGKSAGTATITAKVDDKTTTCSITVSPSIKLSDTSVTLPYASGEQVVTVTTYPSGMEWQVSEAPDSSVATVSPDGSDLYVRGVGQGTTSFTVKNNSTGETVTCSVDVGAAWEQPARMSKLIGGNEYLYSTEAPGSYDNYANVQFKFTAQSGTTLGTGATISISVDGSSDVGLIVTQIGSTSISDTQVIAEYRVESAGSEPAYVTYSVTTTLTAKRPDTLEEYTRTVSHMISVSN